MEGGLGDMDLRPDDLLGDQDPEQGSSEVQAEEADAKFGNSKLQKNWGFHS